MKLGSLVLAAVLLVPSAPAPAQKAKVPKKPPAACGITNLPLQAGNSWTYASGIDKVVVTVLEVAPAKDAAGKAVTEIKVEENINDGKRKVATTWTCTPDAGLVISPHSLLFAGESGGAVSFETANLTTDNVTLPPDRLLVQDYQWVHLIKADVTRPPAPQSGAAHPPARVEIERHNTVLEHESIGLPTGEVSALRVNFELRGRGLVGAEKSEIPVKRAGAFWFTRGIGVVQIDDSFDRNWALTETNVVPVK